MFHTTKYMDDPPRESCFIVDNNKNRLALLFLFLA